MATLAADTPIQRQISPIDVVDVLTASAAFYKGAVLVFDTSGSSGTVKGHAAETAGFAGIALDAAAAAGDQVRVLRQGPIVTPLAVQVDEGDEQTIAYCPANSTNPADANKTSTSNLAIGKIAIVKTQGASGANSVVLMVKSAGYA